MGQEQSYASHASVTSTRRYKDTKYEDPIKYRVSSPVNNWTTDYEEKDYKKHKDQIFQSSDEKDYKRHKIRRSGDSFKSDNTESSGYRSGSSAYESRSDRSSKSDYYYCTSLYKNDHYKDINKEIYKPVKLSKDKRYKLPLLEDKGDLKNERLQSYLDDAEKAINTPTSKKAGIRNYTPKILEEEQKNKKDNWI